jgi:hypothetical protein
LGVGQRIGWLWSLQEFSAEFQRLATLRIGQKAKVADLDQAGRQDVEEEAPDEFDGVQRHEFSLVAMSGVTPAKRDPIILHGNQAPVGNGNPVGIAGQIFEDLLGSTEGRLGMDYPLLVFELSNEAVEFRGLAKTGERAGKAQFLLPVGAGEQRQKGASEASAEHLAGQEKARMANLDPA